jgi:hypothetical protein
LVRFICSGIAAKLKTDNETHATIIGVAKLVREQKQKRSPEAGSFRVMRDPLRGAQRWLALGLIAAGLSGIIIAAQISSAMDENSDRDRQCASG